MQSPKDISTPFQNPLIRFVSEKRFRWLRHSIFLLFGLVLAFKGDIGGAGFSSPAIRDAVLLVDCLSFIFIVGTLYLMTFVLVPQLLFRSRMLLFGLSFLVVIILIYFCVWLLDYYVLR